MRVAGERVGRREKEANARHDVTDQLVLAPEDEMRRHCRGGVAVLDQRQVAQSQSDEGQTRRLTGGERASIAAIVFVGAD